MKVAIVGGGFSGLAAAYKLTKTNHEVTLFEKEKSLGGLSGTFRLPSWQWAIEKHYHHFFTNDFSAIKLIKELGLSQKLIFPATLTSVYYQGKIYPFNTPEQILKFSPLSILDRFRLGAISVFFKLLPPSFALYLEKMTAYEGVKKIYGKNAFEIVWEPLLVGKFGPPDGGYAKIVNLAWFWARVKKRTLSLSYLAGSYQALIDEIASAIQKNGGKIITSVSFDPKSSGRFDKVIITTPSPTFIKMFPELPQDYKKRLSSIPHLYALNLLLITKEKFLKDTYWLNINDRKFPFISIVAQTNMIDKKYYGGNHLTWIGNYLPDNHVYLKMTKEELFNLYLPYLKRINPHFNLQPTTDNSQLFFGSFAQPVFPVNYSKIKPDFKTPIPNVFLANMDMVYPWDRGVNYAIELGVKAAELIK
jgi:protoporphyrinogen oxidase